jgi:hypothetical protein
MRVLVIIAKITCFLICVAIAIFMVGVIWMTFQD